MKFFYFASIFLILSGILLFFSIPTLREIKRSRIIENEISALEMEAEKLDAENNFLKEKIEYLKSDYYKESVAKDRLSLRNMGEKLVVVHPSQKVLGASSGDLKEDGKGDGVEREREDLPNYKKWLEVVAGRLNQ